MREWLPLTATTGGLIAILATTVFGPILAYLIKRYWNDVAQKALDAAEAQAQQKAAQENDAHVSQATAAINQSIDAQNAAKEQWKKDHAPSGS